MDFIPAISHKESQCTNQAKDVTREGFKQFVGITKALAMPKGYEGSYTVFITLGKDIATSYTVCAHIIHLAIQTKEAYSMHTNHHRAHVVALI